MCRFFLKLILVINCVFLFACAVESSSQHHKVPVQQNFVAGKVVFVGTATIPSDASIHVKLNDVSIMDVASVTLGEYTITDITHFPIPFKIIYNPEKIEKGMTYSVSARIEKNGKLLYINDTHIPVFDDFVRSDPRKLILPVKRINTN